MYTPKVSKCIFIATFLFELFNCFLRQFTLILKTAGRGIKDNFHDFFLRVNVAVFVKDNDKGLKIGRRLYISHDSILAFFSFWLRAFLKVYNL